MANSFPSSGTVTLDNGTSNALQITTTVQDNTTRDGIYLFEGTGQASGRQAISWYNGNQSYYKARLWTQVGSGYGETTFGIDVADNSRTLDTRMVIQNGNVGIGNITPGAKLQVGDATQGEKVIIKSSDTRTAGSDTFWNSTYTGLMLRNISSTTNAGSGIQFGMGANNNAQAGIFGYQESANSIGALAFFTGGSGTSGAVPERMRITGTGRVGIGTTNPSANLEVLKEVYIIGGTNPRTVIGDATANGSWAATKWDTSTSTFHIIHSSYSSESGSLIVSASGNVGIKTKTPGTYALNVNGTFYSAGSSQEYKTEISTFDADTDKLMQLRPVTYQYKDEYKHLGKELKSRTQIGLIAEEVAEIFPELAVLKEDEDKEIRVRNVDYEKLSILLLSEVQKLRKEIEILKNKIT